MMNVDTSKCIGCTLCMQDCIVSDIEMLDGKAHIKNESCMECGHCIAICPKEAVSDSDYDMSKIQEYNKDSFDIDSDRLLNFIKFRRSTRLFQNRDVEDEKLEKIIEAGRFTQTGSNLQNVSYVVVKDKIQELRKIVLETLKSLGENLLNKETTPENIKRYCYMWIKMYNDFLEDPNGEDKLFFKSPALIIVKSESTVNASLAASNMELMTNTLGLGTYFSGFLQRASEVNPKINEFLGLKENESLVNCMAIGYPKVKYKRTVPRKEAKITWM
ncbi:MAG: nitroreductase family protein [Clostridium perfringens]|nr:nitroreductase family protein [Clostridium perfringens]